MNKYSKKKNIWNTTYDLQSGPISVVLGAVVLAVFYAIGAIVYHISKFSILNWLLEEGYMGFLDNILTGFILIGFATIIICSIWCIIIEPILKQVAIARYCRLPLTEEEIKLGIETGDFSSLSTYFAYLNKQMSYGICCLNFTIPEIKLAINNVVNVFKPRLAEYEDAAEEENNKKLNESYRTILNNLIKNHKYELLEMYTRDECAYDFELILSALGISSNILDQFQP